MSANLFALGPSVMVTTALIPAPELLFVTMPLRLNVGGGVGVGLGLVEELDPPQPAREKATTSAVKVRRTQVCNA